MTPKILKALVPALNAIASGTDVDVVVKDLNKTLEKDVKTRYSIAHDGDKYVLTHTPAPPKAKVIET